MNRPLRFVLGALLGTAVLAAASAAPITNGDAMLLGVSHDWQAFTSGSGSDKMCYAMAKPSGSSPRAKRDPIYFLISDWPGRKAKSEPEVVPGYQYKADSTVTATIGGEKFELFTQNEGGEGAAWVRHRTDEIKLIEAMKRGQKLVITGTSMRGTKTTDTYSLAGLGDALDKIHQSCGM